MLVSLGEAIEPPPIDSVHPLAEVAVIGMVIEIVDGGLLCALAVSLALHGDFSFRSPVLTLT